MRAIALTLLQIVALTSLAAEPQVAWNDHRMRRFAR